MRKVGRREGAGKEMGTVPGKEDASFEGVGEGGASCVAVLSALFRGRRLEVVLAQRNPIE